MQERRNSSALAMELCITLYALNMINSLLKMFVFQSHVKVYLVYIQVLNNNDNNYNL